MAVKIELSNDCPVCGIQRSKINHDKCSKIMQQLNATKKRPRPAQRKTLTERDISKFLNNTGYY